MLYSARDAVHVMRTGESTCIGVHNVKLAHVSLILQSTILLWYSIDHDKALNTTRHEVAYYVL